MCLLFVFQCSVCQKVYRNYRKKISPCYNPLCTMKTDKRLWKADEPCNASCFSERCGLVIYYQCCFSCHALTPAHSQAPS